MTPTGTNSGEQEGFDWPGTRHLSQEFRRRSSLFMHWKTEKFEYLPDKTRNNRKWEGNPESGGKFNFE